MDGAVGIALLCIDERADAPAATSEARYCRTVVQYVVFPVRCLTHRLVHEYLHYHADLPDIGRRAMTSALDMG